MGNSSGWRISGAVAACAAFAVIAACGARGALTGRPSTPERARGPTYWESEIPKAPEPRPKALEPPGQRPFFEGRSLLDGEPPGPLGERGRAGTGDRFLWEDGAPEEADAGAEADPQRPLRVLDREAR